MLRMMLMNLITFFNIQIQTLRRICYQVRSYIKIKKKMKLDKIKVLKIKLILNTFSNDLLLFMIQEMILINR